MRLAAGWQALKRVSGRRTVGSVAVASLMATAVVVAAVQSDGTEATNVQLNDGSVWVSNGADQRVGRLNLQIRELDFSIYSSAAPDVLQEGRTVILPGREAGLQRLDVLSGSVSGTNERQTSLTMPSKSTRPILVPSWS